MVRANPFYARTQEHTTTERHALRSPIEAVKAEVRIEDYLRAHGVEVKRDRGRCIVHGGDNPQSFSIDPERQLWYCFSCGEGGDLIDLCEAVERHADTWNAVVSLAMQFDIPLPEKPDRWRTWQDEKGRRRAEITRIRTRLYQRRLLRWCFRADLESIADLEERQREAEHIYSDLYYLARLCAEGRAQQ